MPAGIGRDNDKRRQATGVNTFVRAPKHEAIRVPLDPYGVVRIARRLPACAQHVARTELRTNTMQAGILYRSIIRSTGEAQCVSHNLSPIQPTRTGTRIQPLASSVSVVLAISDLVNQGQEPSICCYFLRTSSSCVWKCIALCKAEDKTAELILARARSNTDG